MDELVEIIQRRIMEVETHPLGGARELVSPHTIRSVLDAAGIESLQQRLAEVEGALERRRNIYLAKRDKHGIFDHETDTPWERYDFAAEAVECVAADLGVALRDRPKVGMMSFTDPLIADMPRPWTPPRSRIGYPAK